MSRKYKFWDSSNMYFISFTTVHWIDVFTPNEYKDELVKSFQYCQEKKGLEIFACCIMPSHVHMIVSSHDIPLEDIIRDLKRHTSEQFKKLIKAHPQESRREPIRRRTPSCVFLLLHYKFYTIFKIKNISLYCFLAF